MENPVPYGVRRVLEMTRQHRILDATAFLLEKAGDYAGAYALVHATLKEKVSVFNDAHVSWLSSERGDGQPDPRVAALKQLRAILAVAIQTCIRSSSRLEEAGREGLWFPLLDLFIDAQQAMKEEQPDRIAEYLKIFRDLTRHVVLSMIECVGLHPSFTLCSFSLSVLPPTMLCFTACCNRTRCHVVNG